MKNKNFISANVFTIFILFFYFYQFYSNAKNGYGSPHGSVFAIAMYVYLLVWGILNFILFRFRIKGLYTTMIVTQWTVFIVMFAFLALLSVGN